MKSMNSKLMILLTGFALMGVGCANNGQFQSLTNSSSGNGPIGGDSSVPAPPTTGTGGPGTGSGTNKGYEADFTPVSFEEFNNYVGPAHPLNNPSNFKLSVQVSNVGNNRYGGKVNISYTDAGQFWPGEFVAGTGLNPNIKNLNDNGLYEAEYNYWYVTGGKTVFSGFFQDKMGSIIVVIDNAVNVGDAQGSSYATGTVYYKNFPAGYAPPQFQNRKCWFLTGYYTCRDESIINKTSLVPASGYRKLGTFSGLVISEAFKN